jgi:glycosyltransferase involved in cell wall biosynthesis
MTNKKQNIKQSPRISVIMPTYNQASYLPSALDSIFQQTFSDFELIVVNDGSTDQTKDILETYQTRFNFQVICQENSKLPKALNTGFAEAKGEYLTWTSSDNILLPNMLAVLSKALDENDKVGMVYADWQVIDHDGNLLGEVNTIDFDRYLLRRLNFINACFLYRRTCMDKVGLYDPDYIYAEDWEYWFRISKYFPIIRIPRPLYKFRIHGKSLTESEVLSQVDKESIGYKKLVQDFKSNPFAWYYSKLKLNLLKRKIGRDPLLQIQEIKTT